jgi:hypothetical protein
MGEAKKRAMKAVTERIEAMVVDTSGGRIHVQWDQESNATPNGQLTFFAEFFTLPGYTKLGFKIAPCTAPALKRLPSTMYLEHYSCQF